MPREIVALRDLSQRLHGAKIDLPFTTISPEELLLRGEVELAYTDGRRLPGVAKYRFVLRFEHVVRVEVEDPDGLGLVYLEGVLLTANVVEFTSSFSGCIRVFTADKAAILQVDARPFAIKRLFRWRQEP